MFSTVRPPLQMYNGLASRVKSGIYCEREQTVQTNRFILQIKWRGSAIVRMEAYDISRTWIKGLQKNNMVMLSVPKWAGVRSGMKRCQ